MSKMSYILRCVRSMKVKNLFDTVNKVHDRSKKNRLFLLVDIVWCGLRYGTGHRDYDLNEWWELNGAQRKTYITRGINNALVKKFNDPEAMRKIDNKIEFNRLFSKYLGRKWIYLEEASREEFISFMESVGDVIAKPVDAACGRGVEKIEKGSYDDAGALYDHLKESKATLVEEYVYQHAEMSKLYPLSVNTLRIVTILSDDGTPHIVYAFVRIGNGGRVVDNLNAGGMAAPIDLEKGVISGIAFDKDYFYYDTHPYTGTPIVGHKIPYWDEACRVVLEACLVEPKVRYIGWDVAITENGPTFIEANEYPGHDILQMPPHVPDKIGILPRFREFVDF